MLRSSWPASVTSKVVVKIMVNMVMAPFLDSVLATGLGLSFECAFQFKDSVGE
jgi:hypothetical protein